METIGPVECGDIHKALTDLRDFGLRDQITRASLSIPSRIAEVYERDSNNKIAAVLNYSKGLAGELPTQIYIGIEIGYIPKGTGRKWLSESKEMPRTLHGLMKSIRT